jgi:hypothetical protein
MHAVVFERRAMRRKLVVFLVAFASVFGVVGCGTEAEVEEAEQEVEEAKQEVKVKEAEQEQKEAELKVKEEEHEHKEGDEH